MTRFCVIARSRKRTAKTKLDSVTRLSETKLSARLYDATAFYRYCPRALLFGTWDSTAGEGLNSAKVPRAIVSEIVGVDAVAGVRTASRIDPLGIERTAATIYRRKDGDWAAKIQGPDGQERLIGADSEDEIERNKQGLKKYGQKGRPSDINHGNIPPDLVRFDQKEVRDQSLDRGVNPKTETAS
jgi:CRISPR-associated protein Csb1